MTKKGLDFMVEFVRDYLSGEKDRMIFDIDFDHYLIENYPEMEREDPEAAECFAFYLSEEGIDRTDGLSDSRHKSLIRKQFKAFHDALRDGMW
jgi:hypothetical protein